MLHKEYTGAPGQQSFCGVGEPRILKAQQACAAECPQTAAYCLKRAWQPMLHAWSCACPHAAVHSTAEPEGSTQLAEQGTQTTSVGKYGRRRQGRSSTHRGLHHSHCCRHGFAIGKLLVCQLTAHTRMHLRCRSVSAPQVKATGPSQSKAQLGVPDLPMPCICDLRRSAMMHADAGRPIWHPCVVFPLAVVRTSSACKACPCAVASSRLSCFLSA